MKTIKTIMVSLVIGLATLSLWGADAANTDKTLVVWVAPANLTHRGGSAITIQSGDQFDGIVFGELQPGKWMAGSDYHKRTEKAQDKYVRETANSKTMVQMAIVYAGDEILIYRNGQSYASYRAKNIDLLSPENNIAVFGLRHVGAAGGHISGAIEDARIYRKALTVDEIKSLQPNKKSEIEPYAWWDFEADKVEDRTGRFAHSRKYSSLISIDSSYSSIIGDVRSRAPKTAPVLLAKNEPLKLRVFIDRSVAEVFANGKQCVAMRVYPSRPDSLGVSMRSQGKGAVLKSLNTWQMKNIYG